MTISKGDTLPAASFHVMTDDGPSKMDLTELTSDKTVVLFGVPGAFTPTCHANHLPGYLDNLDALKEKGVDEIAVTTVNDVHVVNEWAKASGGKGKIHFLADGNGEFAKATGLDIDLGMAGMGVRSKRYSMIIKDGVVVELNIEDNPGQAEKSAASVVLTQL